MMLLAQTRWDCKETSALFCTRVEYEVHVGVCVYNAMRCCFVNSQNGRTPRRVNTHFSMLFCQLTKWPHTGPRKHPSAMLFGKLRIWQHARMPAAYVGQCSL